MYRVECDMTAKVIPRYLCRVMRHALERKQAPPLRGRLGQPQLVATQPIARHHLMVGVMGNKFHPKDSTKGNGGAMVHARFGKEPAGHSFTVSRYPVTSQKHLELQGDSIIVDLFHTICELPPATADGNVRLESVRIQRTSHYKACAAVRGDLECQAPSTVEVVRNVWTNTRALAAGERLVKQLKAEPSRI